MKQHFKWKGMLEIEIVLHMESASWYLLLFTPSNVLSALHLRIDENREVANFDSHPLFQFSSTRFGQMFAFVVAANFV